MSEEVKTVGSQEKPAVQKRNPWYWIPTLYFVEGLPYFAVNTISVLMFKKLGMLKYGHCTLYGMALSALGY